MLKVIAYTGGHNNPSAVWRVRQYIPHLKREGIEVTEWPSSAGSYPPEDGFWKRVRWGVWNLAEHAPGVCRSYSYDLTLLQREMLSTFVTFEPFSKKPRVLDVDDAIWVHRGGGFARRLANCCEHIVCGNSFLAERFSQWNPNVSVLPTGIDTNQFVPRDDGCNPRRPVIGWLGLSSGVQYLRSIEAALGRVLRNHPECLLRVISGKAPEFHLLPAEQVEYLPYSPEKEVEHFQSMTIGIMPLDDTEASRGKCSYKMIQYMACGVPVVASPIGMNAEILQKGEIGFGATTPHEWVEALQELLADPDLCTRLGHNGRQVAQQHFSLDVLAPRLANTLKTQVELSTAATICAAS